MFQVSWIFDSVTITVIHKIIQSNINPNNFRDGLLNNGFLFIAHNKRKPFARLLVLDCHLFDFSFDNTMAANWNISNL